MCPDLGHSWALLAPPWPVFPPCGTRGDTLPFVVPRGRQHPAPLGCAVCWGGLEAGPLLPLRAHPPALFTDCSQPLDVALLLDGSSSFPASYFEEMKSFAKAFISRANIGE